MNGEQLHDVFFVALTRKAAEAEEVEAAHRELLTTLVAIPTR